MGGFRWFLAVYGGVNISLVGEGGGGGEYFIGGGGRANKSDGGSNFEQGSRVGVIGGELDGGVCRGVWKTRSCTKVESNYYSY